MTAVCCVQGLMQEPVSLPACVSDTKKEQSFYLPCAKAHLTSISEQDGAVSHVGPSTNGMCLEVFFPKENVCVTNQNSVKEELIQL